MNWLDDDLSPPQGTEFMPLDEAIAVILSNAHLIAEGRTIKGMIDLLRRFPERRENMTTQFLSRCEGFGKDN